MTRRNGLHTVAAVSYGHGRIECACGWRLSVQPDRHPETADELAAAFTAHRGPIGHQRLRAEGQRKRWGGSV